MTNEQPELAEAEEEVAEAPPEEAPVEEAPEEEPVEEVAEEPEPEPQTATMVSESGRTVLTATMAPDGAFQVNGVRDGRQFGRMEQNHEQHLFKE